MRSSLRACLFLLVLVGCAVAGCTQLTSVDWAKIPAAAGPGAEAGAPGAAGVSGETPGGAFGVSGEAPGGAPSEAVGGAARD